MDSSTAVNQVSTFPRAFKPCTNNKRWTHERRMRMKRPTAAVVIGNWVFPKLCRLSDDNGLGRPLPDCSMFVDLQHCREVHIQTTSDLTTVTCAWQNRRKSTNVPRKYGRHIPVMCLPLSTWPFPSPVKSWQGCHSWKLLYMEKGNSRCKFAKVKTHEAAKQIPLANRLMHVHSKTS